jgi:hypothetical protein
MRYVEEGKTAFVDSEVLATPGAMVVYRNSINSWDPPHESDVIDDDDRERIIRNIRLAFESSGYQLGVI